MLLEDLQNGTIHASFFVHLRKVTFKEKHTVLELI